MNDFIDSGETVAGKSDWAQCVCGWLENTANGTPKCRNAAHAGNIKAALAADHAQLKIAIEALTQLAVDGAPHASLDLCACSGCVAKVALRDIRKAAERT